MPPARRRVADTAPPATPRRRGRAAADRPVTSGLIERQESTVSVVPVAAIASSRNNPRQRLHGIDELAASLQKYGLLQPIVVREQQGEYQLIAGHRRLAAARQAGWETIAAVVRSADDDEAYVLTLIENLQREDLSPREEADALAVLVRLRGWTTRQVAAAVQRSQAFVSKRLRVFEDALLAPAVLADQLSISVAEELLSVPEQQRNDLLVRAIENKWELHEVRAAIRGRDQSRQPGKRRRPGLTRRLSDLRAELRSLRPNDLTAADKRELRQLYLELGMLGRAQPSAKPVFPPLPATAARRSRS